MLTFAQCPMYLKPISAGTQSKLPSLLDDMNIGDTHTVHVHVHAHEVRVQVIVRTRVLTHCLLWMLVIIVMTMTRIKRKILIYHH
jgi:hypothetical protein